MLVVCVGDEFSPRRISRGTRFLSGEPGWCQLGGSVTDFTEDRERENVLDEKGRGMKPQHITILHASGICQIHAKKKKRTKMKNTITEVTNISIMQDSRFCILKMKSCSAARPRLQVKVQNTVCVNEVRDEGVQGSDGVWVVGL